MSEKRDTILRSARLLFNEHGYAQVTTAMLASSVGMTEGHVWYYFKTKRDIFEALFDQFRADIERWFEIRPSSPDRVLGEYAEFLIAVVDDIRKYRFQFRDRADIGDFEGASPPEHTPTIYDRVKASFSEFFNALRTAGHLDLDAERVPSLVLNTIMILRYALEFYRELGEPAGPDSAAMRRAIDQHFELYAHRLTPDARAELTALLDAHEKALAKAA